MAVKRTPLQRKVALRRAGRKTLEWEQARAKLKVAFERAGITTCEFRYLGCWRDDTLSFAHSRKRNEITTPEQLTEVALACAANCHPIVERLPKPEMERAVKAIIAARETPVILDAKGC